MDKQKVESALLHAAASFINRESNRQSLITVTRVELGDRGLTARVFVTVYPEDAAKNALEFLNRTRDDFREYVKQNVKMRALPHTTFLQDPNIGGVGDPVPVE